MIYGEFAPTAVRTLK